jgi:TolB protein
MKNYTTTLLLLISTFAYSQVGIFDKTDDIGKPKIAGSTQYDSTTQVYHLKGGGYNVWFNRDELQFAYRKISGNFILTANFAFGDLGKDPHRKIGWMVRPSLDEASPHVTATLHADGLTVLQWRVLRGAFMRDPQDEIFPPKRNYTIVQLEREGKKMIMRGAHVGEPLQEIGSYIADNMPDTVLAGLFICAHDVNDMVSARAWNVRIDRPVPDNYSTSKDGWIGCRMETMDVFTGERTVIKENKGRFEAPNWMPDGKRLLFNENGSLWTIPIEGGTPEKLNTGALDKNNNDHVISFDGKMLGVSSQKVGQPNSGSAVFVLPLTGGEPKLLNEKTPSYLHGWNPNNKEVAYVANRNGKNYDIYTMNIKGGEEMNISNITTGHVDGPEFSPDGKYIYYNGSQTGTMQIWRMKPDGSNKEQLTFDEYNNWFPHISPDGKWLLMISFPPTIDPGAHPSYKRVMLRLMPLTTGGGIKTIAYMYGGQGTINVPSWSPDSKRIAFVSNSERF